MTRTEVLVARGYDAETIAGNGKHVEASPAPTGHHMGRLAVDTGEGLEATNGSENSHNEPAALSTPEVLPDATNGAATSHAALPVRTDRSCNECGGPLPESHPSGAERLTCSPRCAQLRHNRLRHNRLRNPKESHEMKALQLATVPTDAGAETAPAVVSTPDGPPSVPEARMFDAAMSLSTLLPTGWRAELGRGSITLSWIAG